MYRCFVTLGVLFLFIDWRNDFSVVVQNVLHHAVYFTQIAMVMLFTRWPRFHVGYLPVFSAQYG